MRLFAKLTFVFAAFHFFAYFLSGIIYGYLRLKDGREGIQIITGQTALWDFIYSLLSFPAGRFFLDKDSQVALMPLWVMCLNSLIWGILLALFVLSLRVAFGSTSAQPAKTVTNLRKNVSFPAEVIFLFIFFVLLWSAVGLFEVSYRIDGAHDGITSLILNIGKFPTVPLIYPNAKYENEFMPIDIPIVLINSLIWAVATAMLFRTIRTIRHPG